MQNMGSFFHILALEVIGELLWLLLVSCGKSKSKTIENKRGTEVDCYRVRCVFSVYVKCFKLKLSLVL